MTVTSPPPDGQRATAGRHPRSSGGRRRWGDKAFAHRSRCSAGLSVLAILVLIAYSTTKEAWPIFADDAAGFLFTTRWAPERGQVRQPRLRLRHARHVAHRPGLRRAD